MDHACTFRAEGKMPDTWRGVNGVKDWSPRRSKTVLEGAVEHSMERWLESELGLELVMWEQKTMDGSLSPRIHVPHLGLSKPWKTGNAAH